MKLPATLREPLLHFLLMGLALFLLFGRVADEDAGSDSIRISQQDIDELARQFQAHWNRTPSAQEIDGMVDSYVRDEVLYREGLAMGLDAHDPVIKRRIRQKLEVVSEEVSGQAAPTDAELTAYLERNVGKFGQPTEVGFQQIYFPGDVSAAHLEAQVAQALTALNAGAAPSSLGESTLLPASMSSAGIDSVAREFGADFAAQLEVAPLDEWHGPVVSGFGAHLVRVNSRRAASTPTLPEVRAQVLREWENERRERNRDLAYREMAGKYRIDIEGRPAANGKTP